MDKRNRDRSLTDCRCHAFDIAVANISATAIETLAARLETPHLLTSGYLATDGPEAAHYRHVERRELDGWAADSWSRA